MNADPKDSPKDRRRERTRKEILTAAAEVFARKGFHEATIQEIARVAALSAGSLYNYFDNKEALFNDLMEDVHESFEKILVPPPTELDFDAQLRHVVATLFRFGEEYRDHFRFFMLLHWSGGLSLGRDMGLKAQARQEMLGRYVFSLLVAAKERGQLAFADPETATLLVVGVMTAFGFRWFHGYGNERLTDCTDEAVNLVLHGLMHQDASGGSAATTPTGE